MLSDLILKFKSRINLFVFSITTSITTSIAKDFFYAEGLLRQRPTVCVTCAGAGTAKPSSQENDKA
jgi:hypothetical protein